MSTIDQEMVLAHFIVSDDVERSRRFYTDVLGGKTVISSEGMTTAISDGGILLRCEFPGSRTAGRHSCTRGQS